MIDNLNCFDLLEKLNIPKDQLVICGSALLVVHNLIPKNQDLDIVVSKQIQNDLLKKYENDIRYNFETGMYRLFDGKIEFSNSFKSLNLDFDEIIEDAINISGYYFMSFERLLEFYKKLNRPKDQEKIRLIEDV